MRQQQGADVIGGLIGDYAEKAEGWKREHDQAMRCHDVDDLLTVGIALAIALDLIDVNWRTEVHSGQTPYSQAEADEISGMFASWLEISTCVTEMIADCEGQGYKVKRAEQFRELWREVRGAATPDPEFFDMDAPAMIELRDQAVRDHLAGLTVELNGPG